MTVKIGLVSGVKGQKVFGSLAIGETPAGKLEIPFCINSGREDGPTLVITAGIHGSEYPGIEAAVRTMRDTTPEMIRGTLVVFPCVNIPGFEACEANVNPIDRINLNRIFPGDPNGTFSHLIVGKLLAEVSRVADYQLDLHGGDFTEKLKPFAIFNTSGVQEVDDKSKQMAFWYDTEFVWDSDVRVGYSGTFSDALAKKRIPAIVAEAGYLGTYNDEEINQHLHGIANIMKGIGMLPGKPEVRTKEQHVLKETWVLSTTRGGLFYPFLQPGTAIKKGQKIGEIKNLRGEVVEELLAPATGYIRILFPKRVVHQGAAVYKGWTS